MVSGQSAIPFDEMLRCVELTDMKVDHMRHQASIKRTQKPFKSIHPDWESGQIMVQNRTLKYDTEKNNVHAVFKYDLVQIKNKIVMKKRV